MSEEELIEAILKANPDMTRMELEDLVRKYVAEFNVKRKTALFLILLEHQSEPVSKSQSFLPLSDLVTGLTNVTIVARIAWLGPTKTIKNGIMTRGGILDSTKVMPIVFWRRSLDDLRELGVDKDVVVEIKGCAVRENLGGGLEIHVTERSVIRVAHEYEDEMPYIDDKFKSIADAKPSQDPVFLYGTLLTKPIAREISIEPGNTRTLYQAYVGDRDKVVRCISWSGVPDRLGEIPILEPIRLYYVRAVVNRFGEIEVRMNSYSYIEPDYTLDTRLDIKEASLSQVVNGFNLSRIKVKVLSKGVPRTKDGRRSLNLLIHDGETDAILTALDDKVVMFQGVNDGDEIYVELFRASIKAGYVVPSISIFTADSTAMGPSYESTINYNIPLVKARELSPNHIYVNVVGRVVSLEESEDEMGEGRLILEDDDGEPIRINFRGAILNYSSFIPRRGEWIIVKGAQVDQRSMDFMSSIFKRPPLRLRAFSRIEEYR